MKLSKFDIGAEVISIITKGMYPDPKDALREYIQNGVDAFAKNLKVKIRQESIVIADDGVGMNYSVLRKAIRIGVSDKNPTKNVGFMGIGIYSAFHLCQRMTIYSRGSEDIPNILTMDFGEMKSILEDQKDKRLSGEIKSEELIDLQTILEKCISLTDDGDVDSEDFPNQGTSVELTGIEPEFYSALSDYDEVAEYLRNVIPLRFDSSTFTYAEEVESEILKICEKHNQKFELINLVLQVNSKIQTLFRPYNDIDFNKNIKPQSPIFFPIESTGGVFYGVAWGCLNSVRRKLENKSLRGFILKKQGFSIGRRESLVKFFPRGNTFFDRYSGEVIIVNPKILPNAARNDIEYSSLRSSFYKALTEVASRYDDLAGEYQEYTKGDDEYFNLYTEFKQHIGAYNEFEEDTEILVDKIVSLKLIYDKINGRLERHGFKEETKEKALILKDKVKELEVTIQNRIKILTEKKKQVPKTTKSKSEIAKDLSGIKADSPIEDEKKYENLYELLVDLELKIDEEFESIIYLIDELFIQQVAETKANYYKLLQQLKDRYQSED